MYLPTTASVERHVAVDSGFNRNQKSPTPRPLWRTYFSGGQGELGIYEQHSKRLISWQSLSVHLLGAWSCAGFPSV